jgi:2-aminoadipate transaminase
VGADGQVDAAGLAAVLQRIEAAGERAKVKALYFVSYFSNPSSRSLTTEEKRTIARVLTTGGWRLPVLEDAAYRELYFERPWSAPSVFALSEWAAFPKLYLSTLTKPFSTGLKVGYAVSSDEAWLQKMQFVKGHHDFGTANFNQAILEQALMSGDYDLQLARLRPVYQAKRDALHSALLEGGLAELGWSWNLPSGGLYLWLKGPAGLDTGLESTFCHDCIQEGVLYVPGALCFGDEAPTNYVRLSFGVLQTEGLNEAARRFVRVAKRVSEAISVG